MGRERVTAYSLNELIVSALSVGYLLSGNLNLSSPRARFVNMFCVPVVSSLVVFKGSVDSLKLKMGARIGSCGMLELRFLLFASA